MSKPSLIFDLDGTLIDSAADIHVAVNTVMRHEGLPDLSATQVRSFVGNGAEVLLERCLRANGQPGTGPQHTRLYRYFIEVYETAHDLTTVYPGVIAALDALSAHPLGICTNKPYSPTISVLAHLRLEGRFRCVVGGDTLPRRKPDPAPLLETIARMGGGPAIFIGDSEVDAETAARAGIDFFLYTEGYRKAAPETLGAKAMFSDWRDLPGLVAAAASAV